LTSWSDIWADDGDKLDPIGGALALAGFTAAPGAGEAAIILGNSGRTLYNGFLWDEIADAVNGTSLIANQIDYLLNPPGGIPEPSTYMMLGSGLLIVAAAARRRQSDRK
jgi:hypothetical protein